MQQGCSPSLELQTTCTTCVLNSTVAVLYCCDIIDSLKKRPLKPNSKWYKLLNYCSIHNLPIQGKMHYLYVTHAYMSNGIILSLLSHNMPVGVVVAPTSSCTVCYCVQVCMQVFSYILSLLQVSVGLVCTLTH